MITQEQKDQWVAALRSGEYEQLVQAGSNYEHGGKHCCLGVLAAINGLDPDSVHVWGSRLGPTAVGCFIAMNDGTDRGNNGSYAIGVERRQYSFAEIASFIESKSLEWLHE